MRLLLVEDDDALASALTEQLERHEFVVDYASAREEAALLLSTPEPSKVKSRPGGQRLIDTAALYQALGGGWEDRREPSSP